MTALFSLGPSTAAQPYMQSLSKHEHLHGGQAGLAEEPCGARGPMTCIWQIQSTGFEIVELHVTAAAAAPQALRI